MLPNSFKNYFIKLEEIHSYNTRQKSNNEYFQASFGTETGIKTLVVYKGPIDPQKWTQKMDTKWTQKWTLLTSKKKWLKCLGIAGAGAGLPVRGCGFCPNAGLFKCRIFET